MRALTLLSTIGLAAALLAGCGDDDGNTNTTVNNYLQYKQGATYTYNSYQRDENNTRLDASKQVVIWTVIKADTTYQSRGSVAVIDEATYDGTGATLVSRDTIYVQSSGTGEVYQYDVVGEFFGRVPPAAPYRDSVPESWSKIGDTKLTSTTETWHSAPEVTINNIQAPGIPVAITAFVKMDAMHKGVVAMTTPAGSFAKAYSTDHVVGLRANALGSPVLNDSLKVHYAFDIKAGMINKALDSKTLTLGTQQLPVPGFEMELVSYTVPQ